MQLELFPNWVETRKFGDIKREVFKLSQTQPKPKKANNGRNRAVIDVNKNGIKQELPYMT